MIGLIIFMVFIILSYEYESRHDDVIDDLEQTLAQSRKWHTYDAKSLAMFSIPLVIFYSFGPAFDVSWAGLFRAIAATGFLGLSRITYFNMRLNKRNDWSLFHVGENGWDGYFNKYPKLYYIVAFILLAADIVILWLLRH